MADAGHSHDLIIVRRYEEDEHEHHSSAWKVAHADFMTAMMAFFLIMWLINVTDDEVRKGIADYFNPIHLSQGSTELKGLHEPEVDPEKSVVKRDADAELTPAFNPLQLTPGPSDEPAVTEEQAEAEAEAGEEAAPAIDGAVDPEIAGEDPGTAAPAPAATPAPAGDAAAAAAREHAAFQDPYAVLAALAQQYAAEHAVSSDATVADARSVGVAGGEVDRDPFDPIYWQLTHVTAARTETPGDPASAEAIPADAMPDAMAPLVANGAEVGALDAVPEVAEAAPAGEHGPSATAVGIAETGLRQTTVPEMAGEEADTRYPEGSASGLAADGPVPATPLETPAAIAGATTPDVGEASPNAAAAEALARDIARSVDETMLSEPAPGLSVTATEEGVLVNLTDDSDFSMFAVGSAIPAADVVALVERIAVALAAQPGEVVVRGFTDGRPFRSETYDNWRLSAARAHMAYYMLTRGGLDEDRIVAIEGHADRDLKTPDDPLAPENRRIEILLRPVQP